MNNKESQVGSFLDDKKMYEKEGIIMTDKKIMKRKFISEMSYTEMLRSYSAVDLKEIAKAWLIKGYSKLKKEDLSDLIHDHVFSNLEIQFTLFNLDHLTVVAELYKGNNVFANFPIAANELTSLGIVLEGNVAGVKQVIMPNDLGDMFMQYYNKYNDILTFNTILKDYMELFVTYYGVVKVEQFVDSFYAFNEQSIEKELIEKCILYTADKTKNAVVDGEFLHYYRLAEFETVYKDIETKEEINYKVIDHTILQDFIGKGNIFLNDACAELEVVLDKHFAGSEVVVTDVLDELRVMLAYNHGISDFIKLFTKKHEDATMIAIKEFADVMIVLNTEMPHWELKGNSPLEIKLTQRQMPIVKGDKIQRNDPCPCGSGKKYKKCCMN